MEFSIGKPEMKFTLLSPNEHHIAWIFLLDMSCNMADETIKNLMNAINNLVRKAAEDDSTRETIDIAILEYNNEARVVQDFTPICKMEPITLSADESGLTTMGAGISFALDKVKEIRRLYTSFGTTHYRPWIIMVTSGKWTDDISVPIQRIYDEGRQGPQEKFKLWAIGTPGCDIEVLRSITKRSLVLDNTDFTGVFDFFGCYTPPLTTVDYSKIPPFPDNAHPIPQDW